MKHEASPTEDSPNLSTFGFVLEDQENMSMLLSSLFTVAVNRRLGSIILARIEEVNHSLKL